MSNVIGRRSRIDLMTPAELAIRNAVIAVEAVGAHPLLTDAVGLLEMARWKVADYVDARMDDAASPSVTTENPS